MDVNKEIIAVKSIRCGDDLIRGFILFIFLGLVSILSIFLFKESNGIFVLIFSIVFIIIIVINYIDYKKKSDILITRDENKLIIHSKTDRIIPLSEIINVKQKIYISKNCQLVSKCREYLYGYLILITKKQGKIKVIYVEDIEEVTARILRMLKNKLLKD